MAISARNNDTSMEEILASIRRIIADDAPPRAAGPLPRGERAPVPPPQPVDLDEVDDEPDYEPIAESAAPAPRLTPVEALARDDEPHEDTASAPVPLDLSLVENEVQSAVRESFRAAPRSYAVDPRPAPSPVSTFQPAAFQPVRGAAPDGPATAPADAPASGVTSKPLLGAFGAAAPRGSEAERLVSGSTNAAVAASFGTLARTIMNNNARSMEDVVADLLRPMLRNWLDENLPAVVERLVRAEIERVARGGR